MNHRCRIPAGSPRTRGSPQRHCGSGHEAPSVQKSAGLDLTPRVTNRHVEYGDEHAIPEFVFVAALVGGEFPRTDEDGPDTAVE